MCLEPVGRDRGEHRFNGKSLKVSGPSEEMVFPKGGGLLTPEAPPELLEGAYDGIRTRGPVRDDGSGFRGSWTITYPLVKGSLGGSVRRMDKVIPCLPTTFALNGKRLSKEVLKVEKEGR